MTANASRAPPGQRRSGRGGRHADAPRSSRSGSVGDERRLDEQAVAVLRPAGPAADRLVAALARRAQQPVLLQRVDDLLEADEVRLERRHVGEQERQPLLPAVGEVEDVERRDEQAVHGLQALGSGARLRGPRAGRRRPRDRRVRRARARAGSRTERRPAPSSDSTQIRPPWPSTTWRAIARPRPVPPPADARPVGLVEALEDPRPVGLRDADPVVGRRTRRRRRPRRADRDPDLAAVGAELHRVVDEVDEHLAEPLLVAADRAAGRARRRTTSVTPVALGEQPQPVRRGLARAARGRRRPRAASWEPPSIRARSSSSLTIWTRWPVSTSILAIRSRIRAGTSAALRVPGERLGKQADRGQRRAQLVAEVVDELGPDLLQAAELGGVLEHDDGRRSRRADGRGR